MNYSYTNLCNKAICVSLLVLSACMSSESLRTPQTIISTTLPTTSTINPIATKASVPPGDNHATVNQTPLPHSEEYIIYSKYNISKDQDDIWAISPDNPVPLLVASGIIPRSWSPSKRLWLFTTNGSIHIANSDGSGIQTVYNNEEYTGVDPFWLTDNTILFNAYRDAFSPPDIYRLNIDTRMITQLFPGENKFVQSVFSSDGTWLRGDWLSGNLEIVDSNGEIKSFFDEFEILVDYFNPYQIQRIDVLNKYLIVAKGQGDAVYKLWLASESDTPTMLFDPGNDGANFFMVSPNEQYLALIYITSEGTFLKIFGLETQQLVYQWTCPYEIGTCNFVWSPNSQSIALFYSDTNLSTVGGIRSGIQVMDIASGETRIILNEDVTLILGWHYIE